MSKNSTFKHIKKLKATISKLGEEKAVLEKKLTTVTALEAQVVSLKQEAQGLHEWVDKRDSELLASRAETDDIRQQLKEVRVELGDIVEELRRTQNLLNDEKSVSASGQTLIESLKGKIEKLQMQIKDLQSDDRDITKLRRRLKESHDDFQALVRQMRGQGKEPELSKTGTQTGRLKSDKPYYSNLPKENPADDIGRSVEGVAELAENSAREGGK